MSDWYYRIGERVYGPYSEDDLRGRIKSGKIPSNTSVSRDGFTDWQEASVSLLEKESRPPKTSRGAIFRQKFASIFKRQKGARSFQASPWTRSRKRILFWCLGIVFAGAIACVVVKTAGCHRVGGWVRRILTVFQASAAPSHYTLEKTRTYWLELRQIDKTARESLGKMPEGKNPFNEVGQADMADFDRKDFEDFRVYQFKRAKIVRDCIEKLEKLPVYEVDPALLSYEWNSANCGCLWSAPAWTLRRSRATRRNNSHVFQVLKPMRCDLEPIPGGRARWSTGTIRARNKSQRRFEN